MAIPASSSSIYNQLWRAVALAAALLYAPLAISQEANDGELASQIDELVAKLNAAQADVRDAAEQELVELASGSATKGDAVLALLPESNDRMPAAVRARLDRVRITIDQRLAESATESATVTLELNETPLSEAIAMIEEQSGNKIIDYRERFGQELQSQPVTLSVKDAPFWQAVDQLLDAAGLDIYAYPGEAAIALINRQEDSAPRSERAAYAGPFRFEPTEVVATRLLRRNSGSLRVDVEVSWEPRLRPIALSLPLSQLKASTPDGGELAVQNPEQSVDVEVPQGALSTQLSIPFELPEGDFGQTLKLSGDLQALVPGRQAEFRFDKLGEVTAPISRRRGGVEVSLVRVRKNNAIWELHMRMKLDNPGQALASHRNWAFQNTSYLESESGQRIDHAGFETTLANESEIGMAYLFDLPMGVDGLTWVYETPAAIVPTPIQFSIEGVELP